MRRILRSCQSWCHCEYHECHRDPEQSRLGGEHRDATAATCELCFGYGRTLRLYFHVEIKKKNYQLKPRAQRCRTNISPVVSLSKKKRAVIGRAAAYRSLKKLGRLCEHLLAARRIAANIAKLPELLRKP